METDKGKSISEEILEKERTKKFKVTKVDSHISGLCLNPRRGYIVKPVASATGKKEPRISQYHSLWKDNLKKKENQAETDKLNQIIGIELPKEDIDLIKMEDLEDLINKYEDNKTELLQLIEAFREQGYKQGTAYLENLTDRIFTNVEICLRTGVIAPKVTSQIERTFRELGRRLKRIAWGWTDKTATNLSKMIMIRQYSREKWEAYGKEKLGIKNYFKIEICDSKILPCHNF